ncbi:MULTISPECIES: hypothetical protein [unclassified Mesorhizobium]|uniref:hypothetical protein n=1 Tax=unclassified Mesorhizobium TaxID=325217 RepID=UPI001AEC8144|nr:MULTISPECIES: hypothetical protein [unclassified Mesorhizobium]
MSRHWHDLRNACGLRRQDAAWSGPKALVGLGNPDDFGVHLGRCESVGGEDFERLGVGVYEGSGDQRDKDRVRLVTAASEQCQCCRDVFADLTEGRIHDDARIFNPSFDLCSPLEKTPVDDWAEAVKSARELGVSFNLREFMRTVAGRQ